MPRAAFSTAMLWGNGISDDAIYLPKNSAPKRMALDERRRRQGGILDGKIVDQSLQLKIEVLVELTVTWFGYRLG